MIDAIRLFLAVLDAGSLSKVARVRALAVSSVSRQIDALEKELGIKLLHRNSRFLLLTDAGNQFLPRARAIVMEFDDAKHAISAMNADPRGLLTVTAPSSFGRRFVAPALMGFLQQYPAIELVLHLGDQMVDLRAERVDVAIRIGVLPDSELVATQLAPQQRLVCASPAYLARCGRPATPAQLLEHNCLTVANPPAPNGWWCFDGNEPLPIKGSLRSDDTDMLLQAALAGIGIAHLASWMVSADLVAGRLVQLFPAENGLPAKRQSAIHAVRMPGRSHAAKAQLLIAHLRSAFGDPPYWEQALTAARERGGEHWGA